MKNIGLILLVGGVLTLLGGFLLNSRSKHDPAPQQAAVVPTQVETLLSTQFSGDESVVPPAAPIDRAAATSTALARAQSTSTPRPTLTPFVPSSTPAASQPTATPRPSSPTPVSGSDSPNTEVPVQTGSTPPEAAPAAPAPRSYPLPPLVVMEQELYDSHNALRFNAGVGLLALDGTLVSVARRRAADMATNGYFDSTSPSGETTFTLLSSVGYRYTVAGENIARNNYGDAQAPSVTMVGFVNSPAHRANLLDPRFRYMGVGVATAADGMKYFVVVLSSD